MKNAKNAPPSFKNKKSKVHDDLKLSQELWDTMTDEQKTISKKAFQKALYTKLKASLSRQEANDQSSDKTKKDKENENPTKNMSLRRMIALAMIKHLTLWTSCTKIILKKHSEGHEEKRQHSKF